MTEIMKKFLELVSADKEPTEMIGTANREELISMAKKMGIELTDADFTKPDLQALDDGELDVVAGGSECYCSRSGSGAGDDNCTTCACTLGGHGDSLDASGRCSCSRPSGWST